MGPRPSLFAVLSIAAAIVPASLRAQAPMDRPMPALAPAEARVLAAMSDANILGHLAAADSMEVALSDTAILHSRSDTVIKLAKTIRSDHAGSWNAAKVIGKESGLPLTTMVGELSRTHVFAQPDSVALASDRTIDRHYTLGQVELHRHMLAELAVLRGVARNRRVREHIDAAIPVMRDHLAKAYAVAKAKGFDTKQVP